MKFLASVLALLFVGPLTAHAQQRGSKPVKPVRSEVIKPIHLASLHAKVKRKRKQGGNPRTVNGHLVFDGATDGNRQVDPQIAIGPNHIMHGTNAGFSIFDKQGNYVDGVNQNGFNGGIDPKMFYDRHNQVFGFDLWVYWGDKSIKPVNISISESDDPTKAWNTYAIPAPGGRDGGAIGYSKKWIGYSFPGGPEQTFVLPMDKCKNGKPATVYHFQGNLGHPVASQDPSDDLYFLKITPRQFLITQITSARDGSPVAKTIRRNHSLPYFKYPPKSPQKGTDKTTASGDRNPKNIVLHKKCLWFSQTVNIDGRAGIQWSQIRLNGRTVQSHTLKDPQRSFIQSSLAVNKNEDVLIGFQETGTDMFISPRMAFFEKTKRGTKQKSIAAIGEGKAATEGGAWGDYSGCAVDPANMEDLWTVQSMANQRGRGSTVIAKFNQATETRNAADSSKRSNK